MLERLRIIDLKSLCTRKNTVTKASVYGPEPKAIAGITRLIDWVGDLLRRWDMSAPFQKLILWGITGSKAWLSHSVISLNNHLPTATRKDSVGLQILQHLARCKHVVSIVHLSILISLRLPTQLRPRAVSFPSTHPYKMERSICKYQSWTQLMYSSYMGSKLWVMGVPLR